MSSQKLRSDFVDGYVAMELKDKPPLHPRQIDQRPLVGQKRCPRCTGVYPSHHFNARLKEYGRIGPYICDECVEEIRVSRRRFPGGGRAA